MGSNTLKINYDYDDKYDVLYLSIGNPKPAYGDEIEEGTIIRRDIKTDKIVGLTIIGFRNKSKVLWSSSRISKLPQPFTAEIFTKLQKAIDKRRKNGVLSA